MMTTTTQVISQKQITWFMGEISSFDECKYYTLSDGTGSKIDLIRCKNFWTMYKQFKMITEEKLDRIILARGIVTIGDWFDFIKETKAYGVELRHMFPNGRIAKVHDEWRFYFNTGSCGNQN